MTRVATGRSWQVGRVGAAALAIGMAFGAASPASACGYENPQAVALGTLNWVYPNALHVGTAVWQAEDAGLLPARTQSAGTQAAGPLAFYRAAALMKQFGARLPAAELGQAPTSISVVLIPQVMWTRLQAGPEGVSVRSHADGPSAGDVVIVTSEKVVRALLDGSLNAAAAEDYGLLRLYGAQQQVESVRAVMVATTREDASATAHAFRDCMSGKC
jgi:hypothetical protein